MGRPDDVERLTKQGRTPSQIAADLGGLNIDSVRGYLSRAIGEGKIRWSDIFFNIEATSENDRHWHDRSIYRDLLQDRVAWGDLYALLADLEKGLHERIRATLVDHLGDNAWWTDGVPEDIRLHCDRRRRRSGDQPPLSPCYYTTFHNLIEIINHQWAIFEKALPPSVASNRGQLNDSLYRVKEIRNRTMHPVRSEPPTAIELDFVRNLRNDLVRSDWCLSTPQYVDDGDGITLFDSFDSDEGD